MKIESLNFITYFFFRSLKPRVDHLMMISLGTWPWPGVQQRDNLISCGSYPFHTMPPVQEEEEEAVAAMDNPVGQAIMQLVRTRTEIGSRVLMDSWRKWHRTGTVRILHSFSNIFITMITGPATHTCAMQVSYEAIEKMSSTWCSTIWCRNISWTLSLCTKKLFWIYFTYRLCTTDYNDNISFNYEFFIGFSFQSSYATPHHYHLKSMQWAGTNRLAVPMGMTSTCNTYCALD